MNLSKKTSPVWLYFTFISETKAKCGECGSIYSVKNGVSSNLRKHLEAKHPLIDLSGQFMRKQKQIGTVSIEKEVLGVVDVENLHPTPSLERIVSNVPTSVDSSAEVRPSVQRKQVPTQGTLKGYVTRPINLTRQKKITECILYMVIADLQPFSIVEDRGFKRLVKMLDPTYKLPTRKFLTKNLMPELFGTMQTKVLNMLNDDAEYVSLTTDTWTSNNNESYMAVTAHYVSMDWHQNSVLLSCTQLSERHTAENLRKELLKTMLNWNLNGKVSSVTTDNAANITAAIRLSGLSHIKCFAHTLNLIVQDAAKDFHSLSLKVKAIVGHFHRSTTANEKFLAMQKQLLPEASPLKLIMDVVTRWNSTYHMYERMLKLKDAVDATLGLLHHPVPSLNSSEWTLLQEICQLLKPFYVATVELSSEKNVSASKVIVMIAGIRRAINSPRIMLTSEKAKVLAESLESQLTARYGDVEYTHNLAAATFLDPRFRQKGFLDHTALSDINHALHSEMDAMHIESTVTEKCTPRDHIVNSVDDDIIWGHFDLTMKDVTKAVTASETELQNYKDDIYMERNKNPLDFWKSKGTVYPRLQKLSKKYLSMPATSVPSERTFSKAGQIISDRRSRLKSKLVEQILFLNANMGDF